MKPHVDEVVRRVKTARTLLRPVLCSNLPRRTKLGIYKTYIRSRLTYAAPAWYAMTAETHKKRLRAQENAALRTIVNAPRFVRNIDIQRGLKWQSLDTFISQLSSKMFERADHSRHLHLQGIAPLHARPPDNRRQRQLPRTLVPVAAGDEEDRSSQTEPANP
ncbi:uncharacterized protein LOC133518604 [Cydia pomonella]|uniref:uncharacterized protein LOC133518604 n=1 Tax=Cydia pomonella TaxID=82600 RepID=UPI002ADD51D9|nr:uncharacterized protein LOC133518604 [Cydia pomonella]